MSEDMSHADLKLRKDLVVSRHETAGGTTHFVVKDPAAGRFFRFREPEYFIARQLDGLTPLGVIRRRVEEQCGAPVAPGTLEHFIENIRRLGLLEAEGAEAGHPAHRRGRVRGSLLYLRLKAFDPDRLLDRLINKVRFLFTPSFVAVSAALILLAIAITLSNGSDIGRDLLGLYRFQALVLAWLTVLLVTTAHEFAHGLTCKRFGGEVHEMGFMLLFFMPALYCNVSDAWLFPERSKRLWVTFAGAYFELFIWAAATLAWRVTAPETTINFLALVVMATSGVKTLFNLNPLIKLDGYYLLSDYLDIPNLRRRAFRYLGARIKRLWGSAFSMEATPRERRIYLTYGLLSGAYSFSLLGVIALSFGGYLIGRYQGFGFLLFTGVLMTMFRNPLKKLPALVRPGQGRLPSMKRLATALTVFGAVLAVLFFVKMDLKVSSEFTVLPAHNADVRAEVEGIIAEVLVDEGDFVKEGDVIARLADRDYRADLQKIEAEIAEQQAKLNLLRAGPRREEIEIARAEVAKAKDRLSFAREKLETFESLVEDRAVSRLRMQDAEEQVTVRWKELEQAEGRLKLLLAGSRQEEIEAAEAEVARLEAQRRHLADQLARVGVVSPATGVITTPKLKQKLGEHVSEGDLIAKVHELKTVRAEIPVPEKEIAAVKMGQRVVHKARAYPDRSFYGTVTAIAIAATTQDQWQRVRTILVTTEIDNAALLLKPEMTGNAKIYCGKRRIVDLMTRRFVRYIRVEFWSWW